MVTILTQWLGTNPDYPLPPGYLKVKERKEMLKYKLPEGLLPFLGRAYILVAPIIHDLIDELFEIKTLEPVISYEDFNRVKPILQKPKTNLREVDAVHIIDQFKPFGTNGHVR